MHRVDTTIPPPMRCRSLSPRPMGPSTPPQPRGLITPKSHPYTDLRTLNDPKARPHPAHATLQRTSQVKKRLAKPVSMTQPHRSHRRPPRSAKFVPTAPERTPLTPTDLGCHVSNSHPSSTSSKSTSTRSTVAQCTDSDPDSPTLRGPRVPISSARRHGDVGKHPLIKLHFTSQCEQLGEISALPLRSAPLATVLHTHEDTIFQKLPKARYASPGRPGPLISRHPFQISTIRDHMLYPC